MHYDARFPLMEGPSRRRRTAEPAGYGFHTVGQTARIWIHTPPSA